MKLSKYLLVPFLSCGLMLSACGTESSSSTPAPSSSSETSSSESSSEPEVSYVITEAKFNELIRDYGYVSGTTSATYDCKVVGDDTINIKIEVNNGKVKQSVKEGESTTTRVMYAEYKLDVTPKVVNRYSPYGDDGYEKEVEEFPGYAIELGELGAAYDKLAFNDFNYNETTHKYSLKQAKECEFEDLGTLIYDTLVFEFNNNCLVKANASVRMSTGGPGEYYAFTSSITGSKFGSTTVTLPTNVWERIEYTEIKAAFDAKASSPYNHREYDYLEGDNVYSVVEDYNGAHWIIDTAKSEISGVNSPLEWFETQYTIAAYEPVLNQCIMVIMKNETTHVYNYDVEYTSGDDHTAQHVTVDQYFNYLYFMEYHNANLSGGMQNITYSTVQ